MKQAIIFCGLALASGVLQAGGTISYSQAYEHLSNNNDPWRESSLLVRHDLAPKTAITGGIQSTERFGLRDNQFNAAYTHAINAKLTAALDLHVSPTHRVLARNAIGGTAQYEFLPAWLVHAGAKTTSYDTVRVNQGALMLERYVSDFSWSVGWRPARAFGKTAHSAEVRGSYYYGNKNSVSLILAAGEEATNLGSAIVLANVRSAALVGRHQIDPNWALVYSAGRTKQDNFYTRNGASVGIQYAY